MPSISVLFSFSSICASQIAPMSCFCDYTIKMKISFDFCFVEAMGWHERIEMDNKSFAKEGI